MQKSAVIFKVLTGEVEIEGAYGIHFVFFNFFLGRNFAYNNGILQNETPDPAIHFFLFCQNLYFREPSIKSGRSIRWRDDDENTHDPIYEKIYFIKDTVSGLFKKPGENKNQAGGSGNHLAAPEQENLIPWKLPEVSNGKAPKIVKINKNLEFCNLVMETSKQSEGPPIIIQRSDSTPHKTESTPQKTVNIPMTSLKTGPTPQEINDFNWEGAAQQIIKDRRKKTSNINIRLDEGSLMKEFPRNRINDTLPRNELLCQQFAGHR